MKRYLTALLILMIAGCNTTTASNSETNSEGVQSAESQTETTSPSPAGEIAATTNPNGTEGNPPTPDHTPEQTPKLKPAPTSEGENSADESQPASEKKIAEKDASTKGSSGNNTPGKPTSKTSQNSVVDRQQSSDAAPPVAASVDPTEKENETAAAPAVAEPLPEIKIDQTVCGSGGQEAYFETRRQEIYICRNENATLTYIATPKKKQGNSVFLPATAVPDGDKTAYIAQDGTTVVVVGPFGYRREENGKAIAKEKVIRNR